MGDVKGFMPPQGILVVTAMIPKEWEVKFIDENIARVTPEEFAHWRRNLVVCVFWRRLGSELLAGAK